VIVADGLHSLLRRMFTDDELICSGFAAYRGTARAELVTARSELDEVVGWIGLTEYQHLRAPQAMRVQRTARTWGDIWHVDGVGALLRDELFRRRPADDYGYTDWLYGSVGTSVR